jgi:DNA mismatch endonuclease (patch repair protein)
MIVRRLAHGMGHQYRLYVKELPGTPDIAMISKRKIVEVRGSFWHGHAGCTNARIPRTQSEF